MTDCTVMEQPWTAFGSCPQLSHNGTDKPVIHNTHFAAAGSAHHRALPK